jgi:undecaprenyl-phosphate 4-deoxy-4-formamido-L-arabinose transferase
VNSLHIEEKSKDLSIIIPCYNSAMYLAESVQGVIEILKTNYKLDFEILLVVDGSPDNTIFIARELASSNSEVRAIELSKNFGQHAALFAGISQARGELILTMDDDGQHTPSGIQTLLNSLTPDFDVIYGVSDREEHNFFRNFTSRFAKAFIFRVLGIENARHISAFRLLRRNVISNVEFSSLSRGTLDVIINWNTNKISWTEVRMIPRPQGKSNYRLIGLIRFAFDMITNYSTRPLRFATILGTFGFLLTSAFAAFVGVASFNGNIQVPGYASIMILVSALGSIQLLTLGVVGEYLGKIHEKSSNRPNFNIRQIWN